MLFQKSEQIIILKMPIYTRKNEAILFIHIPKCGGSTFSDILVRNKYEESFAVRGKAIKDIEFWKSSPQHIHRDVLKKLLNFDKFDKIITIVREPFERLKSEYYWLLKSGIIKENEINPRKWFDYLIEEYDNNKYIHDNHIRPQNEFLLNESKVFKLEEQGINKAIEYALNKAPLMLFNNKNLKKTKKNELIDNQFLEIESNIKNFYSEDYRILGY